MNLQIEVVKEIEKFCGKCSRVSGMGWHFMFNDRHMFYMPKIGDQMIRFSIPHIIKVSDYDKQTILYAINETNRNVKYVKAVILNNDSISVSYDHNAIEGESLSVIVTHMIKMLDFASSYLLQKLS